MTTPTLSPDQRRRTEARVLRDCARGNRAMAIDADAVGLPPECGRNLRTLADDEERRAKELEETP